MHARARIHDLDDRDRFVVATRSTTVSGQATSTVVLEPGVGGRIFERSSTGTEYDWGIVTSWDPPHQLSYLWHLGREPGDATAVEIRFEATEDQHTLIEIRHQGWERLASDPDLWRERNQIGWKTLLPHFTAALEQGER